MACANFATGTITLSSNSTKMSISGLGFTPNKIIVALDPSTNSSTQGMTIYADETNYYADTFDTYDSAVNITSRAANWSFGTTTSITLSNNSWAKGTYRYVAWREE